MLIVRQSAELSTGTAFHSLILFKTAPSAGYTLPPGGETEVQGSIDHRRWRGIRHITVVYVSFPYSWAQAALNYKSTLLSSAGIMGMRHKETKFIATLNKEKLWLGYICVWVRKKETISKNHKRNTRLQASVCILACHAYRHVHFLTTDICTDPL